MLKVKRSLFRSQALEQYIQSREKHILPRITRPPVFLCLWILLGLCLTSMIVAWLDQVPVSISGPGVVLDRGTTALVFLPTSSARPLRIRTGAPARLQVGASGQMVSSTISQVESGMLSPREAQKRFGLTDNVSPIILVFFIGVLQVALLLGTSRLIHTLARQELMAQGKAQGSMAEALMGMTTLKAMGAEHQAFERWSNLLFDLINFSVRRTSLSALLNAIMTTLWVCALFELPWFGTWQVINGSLSSGTMLGTGHCLPDHADHTGQ